MNPLLGSSLKPPGYVFQSQRWFYQFSSSSQQNDSQMLQGIIALTSSSPIQICNVIEDAKITFRFIQLLSIVKSVKQKKCFRIGFLIQFCPIFLLFWLSRAIDWNLEISGLLETTTWRLWSTVFKVDFFFARCPPRALQARVLTSVHPRSWVA